jgi:alpha-mannosidase
MNKIFCVISHTHWDREWYEPLERFRLKLVDLMDNLLGVLEKCPEFVFHLDAQTIVLKDYLEIRPYKEEILKKYISEGRLLVGPWYVQNDFYLTSGEATIRNLIIGSQMAEDMGKCTWVGYTPDQFGLISQLPQIFKGFGMDSCIFGRGYTFLENVDGQLKNNQTPSELIWEGADGTKILAVHMPYWYNNAQRFSEDINKSMKLLNMIEKNFENIALTPYLLLMNGVDHLEAQENLLSILEELGKRLPGDKVVKQYTMGNYVEDIKECIKNNRINIPSYRGEMRNGHDYMVLQGTLSSRVYLKTMNTKAQNLLECSLEPLYAFIQMAGAEGKYPSDFINYLWKLLIQNHPHDSICGCSRDEVHNHMTDRFSRISEAGDALINKGMQFISDHVSRAGLCEDEYLITIFNTTENCRNGIIDIELQFPIEEKVGNFLLSDNSGSRIPYIVTGMEKKSRDIFSPINLPGSMEVNSYKIQFYIEDVGGLGYKTLIVKPIPGTLEIKTQAASARTEAILENEFMKVILHGSGKIDLLNKESGKLYYDILKFEDAGDCGDSYVYGKVENECLITSESFIPEISCIRVSEFESTYKMVFTMALPEHFDKLSRSRSEALVNNRIETRISLKKGCSWLNVSFSIDNMSKDHRLRALVNTGINVDFTNALAPFDVVSRDRREVLKGIKNGTEPNSGFVDINDINNGLSVLNEGLYEYEHLLSESGTIAVTLLRVNGKISADSQGETWQVPGNQCIGNIKINMALYPHKGDYMEGNVPMSVREFQNPLLSCYQPVSLRKFLGGRPAVQDSEIKEIFYREDPYEKVILQREQHFVTINGKGIVLSALKRAEKDDRIIVRVYNSGNVDSSFEIEYFKNLSTVEKVSLNETKIYDIAFIGCIIKDITLKPKEIYTIALR